PRFKRELPRAQLEISVGPCATVPEAMALLRAGRVDLAAAAEGIARPACAGLHPFAAPTGPLSPGERYDQTRADYGVIAQRQLVDRGRWWWELRPHPTFGTLEVRVPDAQTTVGEAGAVAAVVHALAAWLCERFDAGERSEPVDGWRIAENSWSARRWGLDGTL